MSARRRTYSKPAYAHSVNESAGWAIRAEPRICRKREISWTAGETARSVRATAAAGESRRRTTAEAATAALESMDSRAASSKTATAAVEAPAPTTVTAPATLSEGKLRRTSDCEGRDNCEKYLQGDGFGHFCSSTRRLLPRGWPEGFSLTMIRPSCGELHLVKLAIYKC